MTLILTVGLASMVHAYKLKVVYMQHNKNVKPLGVFLTLGIAPPGGA